MNQLEQELNRVRHEKGGQQFDPGHLEHYINSNAKINSVLDEGNKLWAFFQRFIDEHSVDRIKIIRSKDTTITQKINCMDWLARYAEFLTPDQITSVVLSFKDIYTGPNQDLSEAYVIHKHNSEAIPTIVQMIRSIKMKKNTLAVDEETFD